MPRQLLIVGSGGYAKEVAQIARRIDPSLNVGVQSAMSPLRRRTLDRRVLTGQSTIAMPTFFAAQLRRMSSLP